MSTFKRNRRFWMDDMVNGVRYRLPLKTTNWQEAKRLEKEKLTAIAEGKLGSQGKVARQTFNAAVAAYLEERRLFKSRKTYITECERSKPLKDFFGATALRRITAEMISDYQQQRKAPRPVVIKGRNESTADGTEPVKKIVGVTLSNKTVNLEVALLRQILKKYKQWNKLADDVTMFPKCPKPPRILTPEEKETLLTTSRLKPEWLVARCAAILALNTTMRGCELKGLRRKNVDLFRQVIMIERETTKTNAGMRQLPLNRDALIVMAELLQRCEALGATDPNHYVFPSCKNGVVDPTKPMLGWRSAWRSMTKEAGLKGLRFHDLRHQAVSELLEKGLSDQTIMQIAGHVSKEMLAHYSHMRLNAKREALKLLETPIPVPTQISQVAQAETVN
jgi:integrase